MSDWTLKKTVTEFYKGSEKNVKLSKCLMYSNNKTQSSRSTFEVSIQSSRLRQAWWARLGQSSGLKGGRNHYVMIEHWKELVLEWKLGQPVSMVSKPASLNFHPPLTYFYFVSESASHWALFPCSTLYTHSDSQEAASKPIDETSRQPFSRPISRITNTTLTSDGNSFEEVGQYFIDISVNSLIKFQNVGNKGVIN